MKKLLLLTLALYGITAAQTTTTYTVPGGHNAEGNPVTVCRGIESCSFHNLTATAVDGSTLWGLFGAGGYWTQFDYQAFQGQNPGYKAQYCNGTESWTQ